jgi:homoserine kinase
VVPTANARNVLPATYTRADVVSPIHLNHPHDESLRCASHRSNSHRLR